MRYEGEIVWRFVGDRELAQQFRPLGRLLVGTTKALLSPGVETFAREYRKDPGVRVRVQLLPDSLPIVEIDVSDTELLLKREKATLWIPEGFVVYPASDDSPSGWGLPYIPVEDSEFPPDEQAFAPANLKPGLDTSRWTEGGLLGQVLLTKLEDAGFPPDEVDRSSVVVSPAYHPNFGPVPSSAPEPQLGGWKAYRLEMKPFTAQTLATDERQRELANWKRDTFKLLNAHRESIGRDPILPPLRGKADAGQSYAEFAFGTGYSGHMVGEFGSTYKTYNDRAAKLGSAALEYPGWAGDYTMGEAAAFYGGDILVTFAQDYEEVYTDATGFPVLRAIQPYYEISPSVAVDGWLGSPRHQAYIEWDGYDLGGNTLTASFMNLGYKIGNAAAVFVREGQWIQSGNKFWHSRHAEVPTLSWRGYQSENLAYETWPVLFYWAREFVSSDGTYDTYSYETRKLQRFSFTVEEAATTFPPTGAIPIVGTTGYTYGPATEYAEPAFPNAIPRAHYLCGEIYARGQVIAIAPDSGLVLAAAIAKLDGGNYRLVALCHHRADEPADELNEGATRYLRFWYADLPKDDPILLNKQGSPASLPVHARTVIRKKFGQENSIDPGPWNEVEQVNSWKGGQLIDVGTTGRFSAPDLMKYDSLWRFDNEGKNAICIRSSFHPEWFDPIELSDEPGSTPIGPPEYGQLFAMHLWQTMRDSRPLSMNMQDLIDTIDFQDTFVSHYDMPCGESIFCRLALQHTQIAATASFSWSAHGPGTGYDRFWFETTWPLYTKHDSFTDPCAVRFRPMVAYYSDSGEERCLYEVRSYTRHRMRYPPYEPSPGVFLTDAVNGAGAVLYRGLVRGPATLTPGAARGLLSSVQHFSSDIELNDEDILCHQPAVFHVDDADLAFGLAGIAAPLKHIESFDPYRLIEPQAIGEFLAHPDARTQVIQIYNPLYVGIGNIAPDESRPIWRYALWHNGRRVFYTTAGNPQADYPHAAMTAYYGFPLRPLPRAYSIWEGGMWCIGFIMQPLVCGSFQGGFAKDRNGEWVFAVTLCRQPVGTMRRIAESNPDPGNPATAMWFHYDASGTVLAHYLDQRFMASFSNPGRPENFGGYIEASFATQEQLASLMQIPGENVRSFYARVV